MQEELIDSVAEMFVDLGIDTSYMVVIESLAGVLVDLNILDEDGDDKSQSF